MGVRSQPALGAGPPAGPWCAGDWWPVCTFCGATDFGAWRV